MKTTGASIVRCTKVHIQYYRVYGGDDGGGVVYAISEGFLVTGSDEGRSDWSKSVGRQVSWFMKQEQAGVSPDVGVVW